MTADAPATPADPTLPAVLAGYPAGPLDEAVDPDGRLRPDYKNIMAALDSVGLDGVREATARLDRIRVDEGISFIADIDGELVEQPFPLDPIPRVLSAADWAGIGTGLQQRTRALNAFLDDVYGSADLRAAQIVRAHLYERTLVGEMKWRARITRDDDILHRRFLSDSD